MTNSLTTVAIIAPGVGLFAEVNVILVETDRLGAFLVEVARLMQRDGVEVIVAWPVSETDMDEHRGRIQPGDWPQLRDVVKEFSVQMAKNR